MFRRDGIWLKFVSGSHNIGSKHQKHMAFLPVDFLYRVPGRRGPGPVLMKYMHTLGCFPSGKEVPIRLDEFKRTYLREHVPVEVEEWLGCFIETPAHAILQHVEAALEAIESIGRPVPTLHRRAITTEGLLSAAHPVRHALGEVGIDAPVVAVRFVLQRPTLRAQFAEALRDWGDTVQLEGSTPHRRMVARQALIERTEHSDTQTIDGNEASSSSIMTTDAEESHRFTPRGVQLVAAAASPPVSTARDERILLELVTRLAQGAQLHGRNDLAETLLCDGLRLCHDDDTEAISRANYSCALSGCGRFADAEAEAREAVLLSRRPKAFAAWAVAVAYQDDVDRAAEILDDGLELHPGHPDLLAVSASLQRHMTGRTSVAEESRGKRIHVPEQLWNGTLHGTGKAIGSELDVTSYRGRQVTARLDPTRGSGLGQEMRRAGSPLWSPMSTNAEGY